MIAPEEITIKSKNTEGEELDVQMFAHGNIGLLDGPIATVMGTRHASPYGLAVAEAMGRICAEHGLPLLTAGARGCEQQAARACLEAGGSIVLLKFSGLTDPMYPREASDIENVAKLNEKNLMISRFANGHAPLPADFNAMRLGPMVDIASFALVAECGMPSGVLNSAQAFLDRKKIVAAAPGAMTSRNSSGTNKLIQDGALILTSFSDIDHVIELATGLKRSPERIQGYAKEMGGDFVAKADDLNDAIMGALLSAPMRVEELRAAFPGLSLPGTLSRLSTLEMSGAVVRLPDGRYSPSTHFIFVAEGRAVASVPGKDDTAEEREASLKELSQAMATPAQGGQKLTQ